MNKLKYISPLKKGYDEYTLSLNNHNKIFSKHMNHKWGMKKYKYYVNHNGIYIEHYFTPLFVLWIAIMLVPAIILNGVLETFKQIIQAFKYMIYPLTYDVYDKKTKTYEIFMNCANFKQKGFI